MFSTHPCLLPQTFRGKKTSIFKFFNSHFCSWIFKFVLGNNYTARAQIHAASKSVYQFFYVKGNRGDDISGCDFPHGRREGFLQGPLQLTGTPERTDNTYTEASAPHPCITPILVSTPHVWGPRSSGRVAPPQMPPSVTHLLHSDGTMVQARGADVFLRT